MKEEKKGNKASKEEKEEKKENKVSEEEREEKKETKPSKEEKDKEKLEEKKEKDKEKQEKEKKKDKEKPEPEFRDVTPKDTEEAVERYIDNIPEVFVDKYKNYLNMHKEDDELTRRYPDDFDRSVRVLPMEKDGKRSLEMVSTDNKKTQDFHRFLKEGKFRFEDKDIEGFGREGIFPIIRKRMRKRFLE